MVYCGYNPLILTFTNFLGHPSKCSYKWETGVSYTYIIPFLVELWDPTCITGCLNIFPGCLVDIVWYGEPHLPFIDVLDIASAPHLRGNLATASHI